MQQVGEMANVSKKIRSTKYAELLRWVTCRNRKCNLAPHRPRCEMEGYNRLTNSQVPATRRSIFLMNFAGYSLFLAVALRSIVEQHAQDVTAYYKTNAKVDTDGNSIWGGDQVITKQKLALLKRGRTGFGNARKNRTTRWPQGNIPFKIKLIRGASKWNILKVAALWNSETCVNFYEAPSISPEDPHLLFRDTGKGCYSHIGKTEFTIQIVSLDRKCLDSVPTITRLLGHALGLWNEQDRPDRDSYLTIHTKNMKEANRVYFNNSVLDIDTYGLPYDYSSAMQSSYLVFSDNKRLTLVPKDPRAIIFMRGSNRPSFRDYKMVNMMYNCTGRCSNISCSNGGYAAWNSKKNCRCICPSRFSGRSCETKIDNGTTCMVNITSPGSYKWSNYPRRNSCYLTAWLIKAPPEKKIQVKFTTFQTRGRVIKGTCYWLIVMVRKHDLQSDDPGIKYCDDQLKNTTIVSQKEMLLVIKRSGHVPLFEANVAFV